MLASGPAKAQTSSGPDYSKVNDFLSGKRSLLKVDDIAVFNTTDGYSTVISTLDSTQGITSVNQIGSSLAAKKAQIFAARLFNQPAQSTITPVYDYNATALLTFLVQSVNNVPGNSLYWQPFGGGDEPDLTGCVSADFNFDGYEELALSFADGRIMIATANDVNDPSKSLRQNTTSNLDPLSDMAVGDFKGDGGQELAGLTISNGGLKLVIYAVDSKTLAVTRVSSLTLNTPGASPSTPITLASIAPGRFNSPAHDQLAVTFARKDSPAYVEVIDFTPDTLNPREASPTLGVPAGNITYDPYGYIQVKAGRFGLPDNQYDQIVFHSSSPQGGGRFFEILPVAPNFSIVGTSPVIYDSYACAYGVQVGNFDHRQSDPSKPGQTQPNLNDQVAFLYCSVLGEEEVATRMNIYNVDPSSLTLNGNPASFQDLGDWGIVIFPASIGFVPVDLKGRSLTLGEPTVFDLESNLKPSVIIAAPPMHVDFISPDPGTADPMVMNLTAAPRAFVNTYNFQTTDTNKVSDNRKTSWSFGAKEQLSGKAYVGDIAGFGFQVSDTISAAQDLKSSTDSIYGNYSAHNSSLSSSSSFDDEVTYTDTGVRVWSYPVIGKTVCPKDKSPCQPGDLVPLTIQFSGPTGSPGSEHAAGASLTFYQPPWEPGNILSYPANLAQMEQIYLEPGSSTESSLSLVASADGFMTGGGALTQNTNWTVTSNHDTNTDFNQNYSFENDLSITDSIGVKDVAGSSINFKFDLSGSYGLSHLSNESTQLGTSSGLTVSNPGFSQSYQYQVSPYIFGTRVTNAVVDNQPLNDPNSPNPPLQTFGLLRGVFTADPLALYSGRWWQEAYTQAPDVALNHPARWHIQPQNNSNPIPSNCQPAAGSLDCAVLSSSNPGNPWLDAFHQMRGLFITSADFPRTGPQLISAKAGDKLALTARVYNYSFVPMPAGSHVHVRFYFTPWNGTAAVKGQTSQVIVPPNQTPGTTDVILDPIPPFCDGSTVSTCNNSNAPNFAYATTTFDTGAYDYTKNGNVDVVFWVVVWMESADGTMVQEMPGHGLQQIPGTLDYFADAAKLEPIQSDGNSYSNNVGFFPQVFAIDAPESGGLTGPPLSNVSIEVSKINISEHSIAPGSQVDLSGTLSVKDGIASGVSLRYYDGDPAQDGHLFGMDLIPRIRQGDAYPMSKRYMPGTCGVHQLFAVVNKGKPTEVVRRAEPVRVDCKTF